MIVITVMAGSALASPEVDETTEIVRGDWSTEGLWLTSELDRAFSASVQLAIVRDGEELAWEDRPVFFDGPSTQLVQPLWPELPKRWDTVGIPLTVTVEVVTYDIEGERFHEPMMLDLAYVAVRSGQVVSVLPDLFAAPAFRSFEARLDDDEEIATISQLATRGGK
ncbi:MAG: hypothetical protein AAF602_02990 [Myxococcota bacterium]